MNMKTITDVVKIHLKGIGQVMFQNNAWTGLFFLVGIFCSSWLMGLGALIGVFSSTLAAFLLRYKKEDICNGFYGFNGTLVGVAFFFFFEPTVITIINLIIAASLSTVVMRFMRERDHSPFTFPFILVSWIFILIMNAFSLAPTQSHALLQGLTLDLASSLSLGISQVFFQGAMVTGILFLVGIFISSWRAALYASLGTFLGFLLPYLIHLPLDAINTGLFGFNAVLCGIAFSDNRRNLFFYALLSIILSIFIMYAMMLFNLTALTFPFVLASWLALGVKNLVEKKR
jgi:urea transporter